MPSQSGVIICPNPKCQRKIEEPIPLSDLSKTPAEQYYACPHCFTKIDTEAEVAQPQKEKEEKKKEEESPVKPPEMEEKVLKEEESPKGCPHHFGYLASHAKNASIPQECLTCPKVLDCVMKK